MLAYEMLKTKPKEFLSATGMTVAEFEQLLPAFGAAYEMMYCGDKTVAGLRRRRRCPRQAEADGGQVALHPGLPEDLSLADDAGLAL